MRELVSYLTSAKEEFRNVTWPKRPEAVRLTLLVVGGSLLVGIFVGGVDVVLLKGLGLVLNLVGD